MLSLLFRLLSEMNSEEFVVDQRAESLEEMFSSLLDGGLIAYDDLVEQGFTDVAHNLMCKNKPTRRPMQCEERKNARRSRSRDSCAPKRQPRFPFQDRISPHSSPKCAPDSCTSFQIADDKSVHGISLALRLSASPSSDRHCPLDM